MDVLLHPAAPLRGTLTLPPDKALCQRAVLVAALADGVTEICPWPAAEDCQRALEVGASAILPKPILQADFAYRIKELSR